MQTFVAVIEESGFTAAASRLGVAKSVCSRRISDLETDLAAQLVQRTTRSVVPTDAGREFYRRCLDILERIDAASEAAKGAAREVAGRLRLSVPVSYMETLLYPQIDSFMQQNPGVSLQLHLSDQRADLVSDGFDAAIRIGRLDDSGLFAKKIGTTRIEGCAAPSYVARKGMPRDFDDLSNHDCLRYNNLTSGAEWVAVHDGREVRKRVPGRWSSNAGSLNRRLAVEGKGIAVLPDFIIGDAFRTGELVPVLEDFLFQVSDIHVVYPQKRNMPAALRALIDHLSS